MRLILVLMLIMLVSCVQLTPEQQEFKDLCKSQGRTWMYMDEKVDGKVTGKPCYGCMIDDDTHVCDISKLLK